MGIGFTIDTPIRLAPLGIDSSISLVNDDLIEAARRHHCRQRLLPYRPISRSEPGARARRITEYLNLVDQLVRSDTARLRESSFEDPRGIRRYFELQPDNSPERCRYLETEAMPPGCERDGARDELRHRVTPGSTGVNIMTKLDGARDNTGASPPGHDSDAHAALRGFAESAVCGPVIFSAGANPGLFAYLSDFPDFFPDASGRIKKTIVLKVSDFRSAHVQGRMLARRGLWVSEYRLESGLNCGGHAFPTEGQLMGPILARFRERRGELRQGLFAAYSKALRGRGIDPPEAPPSVRVTAQGGIGTAEEHRFLREHFEVDGTGWGSPFLMVPEAVLLDERTMQKLVSAKEEDVKLSWSSPLGVRFWWLSTCDSEAARVDRIEHGHPGSVCTGRYVALDTQFRGAPLCKGSRAYQRRKKAQLDPAHPEYARQVERLQAPACICVDLCGSYLVSIAEAAGRAGDEERAPPPAICPGPNIVNFQSRFSLEDMVGHIYGRHDILTKKDRPHVFLREIELYLQVFDEDSQAVGTSLQGRTPGQLRKMLDGLEEGLSFYREMSARLPAEARHAFGMKLAALAQAVHERRQQFSTVGKDERPS